MSTTKMLHIGMSLAPTWLSGDGWRHENSNVEGLFGSDFALHVARLAEAAHVDFVFRPDVSCLPMAGLESSGGLACLDPSLLLAAIARETSHIGLVSTLSTTFFTPYTAARQLQSLNWLSNGRAGWNIVTALTGHDNFGLEAMPSADERYERAAEFTDVVRRLWASFPHEALKFERESGRYADPSLIQAIEHVGKHFSVRGPLNVPAFPGPRIPLVQAGASATGRDFAASVADVVFAPTPDKAAARELREDLSRRARQYGRQPEAIRLLPGLSLYLAASRAEAHELFQDTHKRSDRARKLAVVSTMLGLDLQAWPDDQPITAAQLPPPDLNPSSRTHRDLLRRLVERESPTLKDLLMRPEVIGAGHWQVIGTVEDAVEQIADWASAGVMDGFLAAPGGSADCMQRVLQQLIPALAEVGLFRRHYSGSTFAEHLGL